MQELEFPSAIRRTDGKFSLCLKSFRGYWKSHTAKIMLIPPTRGNLYLHSVQQPGQYKSREPNAGTSHPRFTINLCKSDHFQDLQENCSQSYCLQCFTDPAGCLQTRLHDYKGSKRQRSLPQVSFCYFKIIIKYFLMS